MLFEYSIFEYSNRRYIVFLFCVRRSGDKEIDAGYAAHSAVGVHACHEIGQHGIGLIDRNLARAHSAMTAAAVG